MKKVSLGICDNMRCPECGNELDEDNYCDECYKFFVAMRFVLIARSGL